MNSFGCTNLCTVKGRGCDLNRQLKSCILSLYFKPRSTKWRHAAPCTNPVNRHIDILVCLRNTYKALSKMEF